jgi:hypothetical protein
MPTAPMISPVSTRCPALTARDSWWQYQISVPSSRVTTVLLPKDPSYAASVTTPEVMARIGVP